MKIVVIFGSPHKNGVTMKILQHFLSSIPREKDISFFDAYDIKAEPCTDCGFCKKEFGCKFNDLNEFYQKLIECDLLICAFPIYNASLPAPMKCMFDRMQPFYFGRNRVSIKGRLGIIITTQGDDKKDYKFIVSKQIAPNLQLLNIKNLYFFSARGTDNSKFDIDKFCLKSENKINSIICELNN